MNVVGLRPWALFGPRRCDVLDARQAAKECSDMKYCTAEETENITIIAILEVRYR